jgi:hypothetical protein
MTLKNQRGMDLIRIAASPALDPPKAQPRRVVRVVQRIQNTVIRPSKLIYHQIARFMSFVCAVVVAFRHPVPKASRT